MAQSNRPIFFANTHLAEMCDIAEGRVKNVSKIDKFGYNSAVGSSFETVWDGNNQYTYIESAGTAVVTSSDSDDNGSTVELQGLDVDYNLITEVVTVGGAASTNSFYRMFRARVIVANTGTTNVGTITITVDSKSAAIINPDNAQTLMAIYTIPRRTTGYLMQLDVGSSKDVEHNIRIVTRDIVGNAFNTKAFISKRGGSRKNRYRDSM
jgi:hypothetical protein